MVFLKREKIYNWSKTRFCYAKIFYPEDFISLKKIIIDNSDFPISFRASGCSYGDCYLNDNGIIIDLKYFNKILITNPLL